MIDGYYPQSRVEYLPSLALMAIALWIRLISASFPFQFHHLPNKYMMTSSNGNIFRVTAHLCGEFTGPGEFPTQRPVTRSIDVYFDLRPNKQLSKQSWGWWFEMLSMLIH